MKVGLVDRIGGLRETILEAAHRRGIKGEPKVVEYGHKGLLQILMGDDSEAASSQLENTATREILERLLRRDDLLPGAR